MKLNKYFLIGAMGLGLFACSDNDLADNGQNGSQAEKTVLSTLTLDFSKMSARAVSDPATTEQNGTRVDASEAESKISNIYIVLSEDGSAIDQIEGGNILDADDANYSSTQALGTATYDVVNKKISFTTTQGEKKVYVVLNADVVPTKTNTIDKYFNELVDLSQPSDKGFMMSNANGAVSAAFWNGQTTELTIPVDRVVAKVTVTATALVATDKSIKDESGNDKDVIANVSDLSFKFKNDRTSGFRMNAAQSSTATGSRNAASGAKDVAITTGVQPSAVDPIYCLEDIEAKRAGITEDEGSEWNVTYLTFSLVYNPVKLLSENLEYEDNEDEAGADHYYIATGEYTGKYILVDTYNRLSEENKAKLEDATLLKYTGGVHHFGPIWVGGTQGAADEGTILRNYWYNYDLATVLLPGKTDEPGTGKKDEDPKAVITVSLLDWIWLNNDIDL